MRSYLDVFIDVQDGKRVEYEELRVALLFCRDLLFFTESDLKKVLESNNPLVNTIIKENMASRFYAKKNPLEKWWNDKVPKIKE
jgi:hypothetical protein